MPKEMYSDLYQIIKIIEKQMDDKTFSKNDIRQYLNNNMRIRVVAPDETISNVLDEIKYVHYVIQGIYFLYRISSDGKMNILSKQKGPNWIGMDKAFVPEAANDAEERTMTECMILDIRKDYLQECIKNDGEFAFYVIQALLTRMAKISKKSDLFVFNNARERLMVYILEYWELYSKKCDLCRISIKNSYIADEIGITSRSLYRALDMLKKDGMIVMKKGDITVTNEQISMIKTYLQQ